MDDNTLQQITERLVKGFDPEKIFLFGSQARGTAEDRSDVDLLVVGRFVGDRYAVMDAMDRSIGELRVACDIVPVTAEEFELSRHIPGSLARAVSRDGKLIYARS